MVKVMSICDTRYSLPNSQDLIPVIVEQKNLYYTATGVANLAYRSM